MEKIDCVIASLPFIDYFLPPAAPAVIKGHLEKKGFSINTVDLNITVKETFQDKDLVDASSFFCDRGHNPNIYDSDLTTRIDKLIDKWCQMLLSYNPTYIGLSVFSGDSRRACELLAQKLKTKTHNSKIVVGGHGIEKNWLETMKPYIDFHIDGEGEIALENLLQGNYDFPGINSTGVQIKNLDVLGTANYEDYDLTTYNQFYSNRQVVQITASRGCIRDCSFCNVKNLWPEFTWRSSDSIIEEITRVYETHGISDFYFTDSLINGNIKVYMQMVEGLAKYNYSTSAKITWGGQYIVRKSKNLSKDYFALTRDSGAYNLALGVESGSNDVLAHIKKGVTRQDLDLFIENFDAHDITCQYQIIVGYPNETEKNFEETLDMFYDHQKYIASGTIHGTTLHPMMIVEGTPLEQSTNRVYKKISDIDDSWGWESTVVDNLNWDTRVKRVITALEVCNLLKWPVIRADQTIGNLLKKHQSYLEWKKTPTSKNIIRQPNPSILS